MGGSSGVKSVLLLSVSVIGDSLTRAAGCRGKNWG